MSQHWQRLLLAGAVIVCTAHCAFVPTTETFVVAKVDDDGTTDTSATTDDPAERSAGKLKMLEMDVRSEVALRYAHTTVLTRMRNSGERAQEAHFRVLLPSTAFISGFTMILDGKPYKAYVKEKEEAKKIYTQAVSQGIAAAHVSAKARDSNNFNIVVNVLPNTVAVFNLTYEEMLVRRNDVYNLAINLHPGSLVPKFTVTAHIKEPNDIKVLRVPEIRTGNEIEATADDAQNTHASVTYNGKQEVTVKFEPDMDEQRQLINIYKLKSKDLQKSEQHGWNNDFIEKKKEDFDVLGQFVVQYDVDRPPNGQVLLNDGYFVHFLGTPDLTPLPKHVVFVLDTSGSMMGRKIDQLREAMSVILSELNPFDFFNIVEFNSEVLVHDLIEADSEPPKRQYNYQYYGLPKPTKSNASVLPTLATPENVKKAKVIIKRLNAAGGTDIYGALLEAISLTSKGVKKPTDSSTESAIVDLPTKSPKANEIDANTETFDGPVPLIIFLTDGDPTVGETDPSKIVKNLSERNYGDNKASIYSLAFGDDADRKFLRKISLRNEGYMRPIYEASDSDLQLRGFYRGVSAPLVSRLTFTYPPEQIQQDSITKSKFRTLFNGTEAVVTGKVVDMNVALTPKVSGFCATKGNAKKRFEAVPTVVNVAKIYPLERLWAYLTVQQLLDEKDAQEDEGTDKNTTDKSPEKRALKIALKYEFVTPLTSLVVVKPDNGTSAVDPHSADKPNDESDTPSYLPSAWGQPGAPGPAYQAQMFSAAASAPQLDFEMAEENEDIFESDLLDIRVEEDGLVSAGQSSNMLSISQAFAVPKIYYHQLLSTAVVQPTTAVVHSTTLKTEPAVELFPWAQILLNQTTDEIIFDKGNATESLKIVHGAAGSWPRDHSDVACSTPVDNSAVEGSCVYLMRCPAAKDITLEIYRRSYCTVDKIYAGVCCPKSSVVPV